MLIGVVTSTNYDAAVIVRDCYKAPILEGNGDSELAKPSRQNFIDNLDYWLWLRRMSYADLARRLEVSRSQVSLWQSGKRFPHADQLDRIAEALGIPVSILLYDKTDPRSRNALLLLLASKAHVSLLPPGPEDFADPDAVDSLKDRIEDYEFTARDWDRLEKSLEKGDRDEIHRALHSLIGLSNNIAERDMLTFAEAVNRLRTEFPHETSEKRSARWKEFLAWFNEEAAKAKKKPASKPPSPRGKKKH